MTNQFIGYDPLTESLYRKKIQLNNDSNCFILFQRQHGQEEFTLLQELQIRGSDCVVIVYEVNKPYNAKEQIDRYLSMARHIKGDITVIIAGTKVDLRNESLDCKSYIDSIIEYCKERNLCYIETSSKDNININFLFQFAIYNFWFDSFQD
ncbi:rap 1A [Reticulomyxa filosa]|uniref:Rap 1A n=1 Tax=Reticulomyxa filosa TaxID=46433 RepID=X6P0Q3_RETFI|nr:rap 1A [Reticulomyxa filosa]|eukprot:ETO31713.1 rap 1A [Reticulomyxa filosa]